MATSNAITLDALKEVLSYDRETGLFSRTFYRTAGASTRPVGTIHASGYLYIHVLGKQYKAHRLAWLLVTGAWPKDQIDHINGIRDDNRWANLRDVDGHMNIQNQHGPRRNNKLGLRGVSRVRGGLRFKAQIRHDGGVVYLGLFDTAERASAAYADAKQKLHHGFVERTTGQIHERSI